MSNLTNELNCKALYARTSPFFLPHGRTNYVFCLWEADKPEDIVTSLGEWLDYLTVDNVKVDEIDWAEYAKTL
jgi:hypothetical protein